LLIIAIARRIELGLSEWWAPLLKFSFTISYVLLAPGVFYLGEQCSRARDLPTPTRLIGFRLRNAYC